MSYLLANLVLLPIALILVYSMYPTIHAETYYAYLFLFVLLCLYVLGSVLQMIIDLSRFVRAEWEWYRDVRVARQQGRERAEHQQTTANARRVYAGSDTIPGNATAVVYEFLGVPQRVTRRGGPQSHTE